MGVRRCALQVHPRDYRYATSRRTAVTANVTAVVVGGRIELGLVTSLTSRRRLHVRDRAYLRWDESDPVPFHDAASLASAMASPRSGSRRRTTATETAPC